MSELAVEDVPDVAAPAREAARGQVIYITEHGQRLAGLVPADLAAALEQLSADQLDEMSVAAAAAGFKNGAALLEDLADRAAVIAARTEPGEGTPWEQIKAESGL
jgi:hypothetical protein